MFLALRFAAVLVLCLASAHARADQPLATVRPTLVYPTLPAADRAVLNGQAEMILKDLFVHGPSKVSHYGPLVNPLPRITMVKNTSDQMTEDVYQFTMSQIFRDLRDLHTNYMSPAPMSCYGSYLPFSLARVELDDGTISYAIRSLVDRPGRPAQTDMLSRGDVLLSYNGKAPIDAMADVIAVGAGANDHAGLYRASQALTFRYHLIQPLPETDVVSLVFKSRLGETYQVEMPWTSYSVCGFESAQPDDAFQSVVQGSSPEQIEYERLFKPHADIQSPVLEITVLNSDDGSIKYAVYENEHGKFGYVRISAFVSKNYGTDLADILRRLLLDQLRDTHGLIIDVRDNGGGNILFADRMVQLFSRVPVEPTRFRMLANETNAFVVENSRFFSDSVMPGLVDEARAKKQAYTATFSITDHKKSNVYAQAYLKPVAVLTNAGCYSACDMFTAQMQDHGAAVIYGEHPQTGAGGANVVDHEALMSWLPDEAQGPFVALPANIGVRLAWRQSVRTGLNSGKLLEDDGVAADRLVLPGLGDMFNGDVDLLRKITKDLREAALLPRASVDITSSANINLEDEQTLCVDVTIAKTDRIEVRWNGDVVGQLDTAGVDAAVCVPTSLTGNGEEKLVEVLGYRQGHVEWRTTKIVRWFHPALTFAHGSVLSFDFEDGSSPFGNYVTGPKSDGFTVQGGRLKFGQGERYAHDMRAFALLDVAVAADVFQPSLKFDLHGAFSGDDTARIVVATADGSVREVVDVSPSVDVQAHAIDLSAFAGKTASVYVYFESNYMMSGEGMSIDNIVFSDVSLTPVILPAEGLLFDFESASLDLTFFGSAGGWTVAEGQLRIGTGPEYDAYVTSDAVLVVESDGVTPVTVSFDAEIATELGYDVLWVKATCLGIVAVVGDLTGEVPTAHYEYSVPACAGGPLMLSLSFTSDSGGSGRGVFLDNLKIAPTAP